MLVAIFFTFLIEYSYASTTAKKFTECQAGLQQDDRDRQGQIISPHDTKCLNKGLYINFPSWQIQLNYAFQNIIIWHFNCWTSIYFDIYYQIVHWVFLITVLGYHFLLEILSIDLYAHQIFRANICLQKNKKNSEVMCF